MGRPTWFVHTPYPEDSAPTVGKRLKEQQDKVDKAKAMLQRVRERQWTKKNRLGVCSPQLATCLAPFHQ